ncbi:hypothetical protein BCON_0052g00100 [Botryotinia convoluta]|uniref:Major facilitator superfamily (MFS) profile domain-containing protein n=1 Tax=Botryotinia convoluta TaxID=54673 RepID=A0A4Z1IB53_9HELO|nr:hypothetical protein BCON_0052g00100 [Botryotinia convoluta]
MPGQANPETLSVARNNGGNGAESYLRGWRLAIMTASLTLGIFLIALDTTVIGVAVPKITTDFKDLNDIAWFGSGYLLTVTAFQPLFGTFYKFFNPKVVYMTAIIIFEVGSVLCAASPNAPVFILGRAIAGFGAAGIYQGALGIIGYTVVLEKRPMYFGIVVSAFAISACIGPILGGALTEHASWRNLPLGVIVFFLVAIFLQLKVSNEEHSSLPLKEKWKYMDIIGSVIFVGSICCILLALQWGGQTLPWNSSKIIGLLIGFILLALAFAFVQWKRGEFACIPLRVAGQRTVAMAACMLFFNGMALTVLTYYIPIYFQSVRGDSPTTSGVRFIAFIIPQMVSLIAAGAVATKWGYYAPYIVAGTIICTIGCGLLTTIGINTRTAIWATFEAIIGVGFGGALQLPYTALAVVLSESDLPTGNAIAVFSSQLGGALGVGIGQTLLLTHLVQSIPRIAPSISPEAVINAGAANLLSLTTDPQILYNLRVTWAGAVRVVFLFVVVASALSVLFSFGIERLNVHVVSQQRKEIASAERGQESATTQDAMFAVDGIGDNEHGKKTETLGGGTLSLKKLQSEHVDEMKMSNADSRTFSPFDIGI